MLTQEVTAVRKTALYDEHVTLGARVVEFAGWAMPMYYEGIVSEHRRVRSRMRTDVMCRVLAQCGS